MKYNHLIYLLITFLMACVNAGCKDDTFLSSETEEENENGIYVSVKVNTGENGVSRANATPTPGENGDGQQVGIGCENRISNLVVFFFQGEVTNNGTRLGINSSNPSSIDVKSVHFSSNDIYVGESTNDYDAVYYSVTKEVSEIGLNVGQTYDVLVVANIDYDPLKAPFEIKTLQDLQNAAFTDIMEKINNYNQFAMSSAELTFNAEKGINSITIKANNTKNNPAVLCVDLERMVARIDCHIENDGTYDVNGRSGDKVILESFIVVNKYFANVDLVDNNCYTYWFKRVVDSDELYNNSAITYLGVEEPQNGIGAATNYVLGPMTIIPPEIKDRDANFPYDHSLYHYKDNTSGWDENWISVSELLGNNITSKHNNITYNFLDYVQENILPVDVLNQQNGMAYYCTGIVFKAKYIPYGLTTTNGTFYKYNGTLYSSLDEIRLVIGNQNISDYNFSQFGITKYQNGICYYTYYIKHAEDRDDTKVSPMEYAVVRNNIYQVNVTSINDIGTVTPTDYSLNLECTVTDWVHENEIIIDFSDTYNGEILGVIVVHDNSDVLVAYSQDNEIREARFTFQMERPVGVGWTAHLTNPDDFEFVSEYHGVGGDKPVTLQIRPRRPFEEGVERRTRMYITFDTDNELIPFNEGTNVFPGENQYIDIRQVSTTEYDTLNNQDNNT